MDIITIILGRYILAGTGACIRYIFHFVIGKKRKFQDLWEDKPTDKSPIDQQDFMNRIIGFIVLFSILLVLYLIINN